MLVPPGILVDHTFLGASGKKFFPGNGFQGLCGFSHLGKPLDFGG